MSQNPALRIGVTLLQVGLASAAFPCGEPLFKMGKGVRYQPILAPLPARILIYEPAAAANDPIAFLQLSDNLRRAGHQVTEAMEASEIEALLHAGSYDIVVASYDQLEAVLPSIAGAASPPDVLPIVSRAQRQDRAISERFPEHLVGHAESLRASCKAVQRMMEARAE